MKSLRPRSGRGVAKDSISAEGLKTAINKEYECGTGGCSYVLRARIKKKRGGESFTSTKGLKEKGG